MQPKYNPIEHHKEQMLLMRKVCQNSFAMFVKVNWSVIEKSERYVHNWHIDAIAEHLQAVRKRQIRNLLINMPPRHAKSTMISVLFPAWVWSQQPMEKFIYASYAYSLSKRDSTKTRSLIESDWYRSVFDIKWGLSPDQNEKMLFSNTEMGFRQAASVGASVVGTGGDYLIVDDPHAPSEVSSDTIRQNVIDWYDEEFSSRIINPQTACKIVVMQRLHESDLSGHLLEKGGWEHLCLPAEFEPTRKIITSIGWEDPRKEPGEALWPSRFNSDVLATMKRDMGSKAAAGQLQQRPAPSEGDIVKREWWKFYKDTPADMDFLCISCDLTFKDGEKNDFAVMQVWGRSGANKYLLDQVRSRMGFNGQLVALKGLVAKWDGLNAVYIEDAANGAAMVDTVRKTIPGIIPVRAVGSKIARAEAVAPQIEAGNIYLPDPSLAAWVHDYIEEWSTFPNATHDDQVDATSQAISKLTTHRKYNWKPQSITGPSKWLK